MRLTAGATLQNQKYAVQKQLHQSDFGVTYQAQQIALGRPVAIQTLNGALQQRSDFAQLRRQFLSRVQAIVQQPVGHLHVLDYFEEDGLPFVVFELAPGQPLPQFSDWIPVTPSATEPAAQPESANLNLAMPLALERPAPQAIQSLAADALTAPAAVAAFGSTAKYPPEHRLLHHSPHHALEPKQTADYSVSHAAALPMASAARLAWMPLALIFISMLGALLGVGLGFSWRFSAKPAGAAASNQAQSPNLTPRLFSREQSFPSGADWPVSELPQLLSPDPQPIELPDRSRSEESSPLYPPPPAQSYEPAPLPPVQSAAPEPEPTVSPSPLEPILPRNQPALGERPAAPIENMPAPAEAAPEPLPPAAPEPPPAGSVDFPPPPKPAKVFQN